MRIRIGDKVKIPAGGKAHPEAGHFGRCVWISKDQKTVAVQCDRSHHNKKNTVFMVKIDSEK